MFLLKCQESRGWSREAGLNFGGAKVRQIFDFFIITFYYFVERHCWFRVKGEGLRVQELWFMVHGSWFTVQGTIG